MKIYAIRRDHDYQSIASEEMLSQLIERNGATLGNMNMPPGYIIDPRKKKGNFFSGPYNLLYFDSLAMKVLGAQLKAAGELNEVEVEDIGRLHALNVLETCSGALDMKNAKWDWYPNGERGGLIIPAFQSESIKTESGLFTIPEDRHSRIYAVSDPAGKSEFFYDRYMASDLKGLSFRRLRTADDSA